MYRRLRNLQIASVIVRSEWDRMVYNTVLTAEKRGPQIVGAQIVGVYCTKNLTTPFPSWLDVPDVLLALLYQKVLKATTERCAVVFWGSIIGLQIFAQNYRFIVQ